MDILDNFYLAVVFVLLMAVLKFHLDRWELYIFSWKLTGPLALPIIGNVLQLSTSSKDLVDGLLTILKKYDGNIRFWFGPMLAVILRTPEDVQIALSQCLDKADFYNVVPESALFAAPVGVWRKRRKLIQPSFNPKLLSSYVDIFHIQAEICAKDIKKSLKDEKFNIEHKIMECFVHMLCETQIGIPIQSPVEAVINSIEKLSDIYFRRMHNIFYYFDTTFQLLPIAWEYRKCMKEVNEHCQKMIDKRRKELTRQEKEGDFQEDVFCGMASVLETKHSEIQVISDKELREFMQEFVFAGTDTGTFTACTTLMMISMHPEVQKKVVDELDDIFGDSDRPVTGTDLKNAAYLDRVIRESMRLFPVSPFIGRQTTAKVKLDKIRVPAGVSLMISVLEMHRSPRYWKDPLKFNPDRFLSEEAAKRHPYCYIPFSAGPRNCIGYVYGMDAVKTILINLMRTFTFQNSQYKKVEDIKFDWKFTLKVANGYGLIINENIRE